MTTHIAALGLVLAAAASEGQGTAGKGGGRIAAVEKDLCVAGCPAIPPDASSDWLRSAEGQKVNACHTGCRLEQPASALFLSACDLASSGGLQPESPLVKVAGKEGPDLARRLRFALKEGEGKKPSAVCARARASLGTADETSYLECMGRIARADGATTIAVPQGVRALRCATLYAERDVDWLKRCPSMETAVFDACLDGIEAGPRARRQSAAEVKAHCESEAVDRIAASFRHKGRP